MKDKKKIIVLFAYLTILFSLTYFLNDNRKVSFIESNIKNYLIDIYSVFPKVFAKSENINITKYLNDDLNKEINELKDLLELNHTLNEFNYVNATVISRNVDYWLDTITIDKGSKSGIKVNDSVVTKNGLIGKVITVNKDNSIVSLLTNRNNYYVSVSINDDNGLLSGYDEKKNLMLVKGIDKNSEIKIDDIVVTNGLGGIFPSGIYVGKVKKIEKDNYDLSKIVYIDIKDNFKNINYVMVLGRNK